MEDVNGKQIKIVFTDVDGTLLDAEHRVIPEACASVQKLAQLGIPLVLVSARMPEGLTTIQREMGFTGPLVCYSGAYVLDEQGAELLSHPIDIDTACEIKQFLDCELPGLTCSEYGYHTWICDDDQDPRIQNEERITTLKAQNARLRDVFGLTGIHKFLLMGEPDEMEVAEKRIAAAYPQLAVALLGHPLRGHEREGVQGRGGAGCVPALRHGPFRGRSVWRRAQRHRYARRRARKLRHGQRPRRSQAGCSACDALLKRGEWLGAHPRGTPSSPSSRSGVI